MNDNEKWRRFRRMAREIGTLIPGGPEADFVWAGGDVICDVCGLPYFDHPVCADGVLHVACDGKLLKL